MNQEKTLRQVLSELGWITYKTQGRSMEPLLHQGRDLVTIRRREPGEPLRENDVVLYFRPDAPDHLILHRVVGFAPDGSSIILGDNNVFFERDILDENIIGVLAFITRKGRHIEMDDPWYLEYVDKLRRNQSSRIRRQRPWRVLDSRLRSFAKRLLGPKLTALVRRICA